MKNFDIIASFTSADAEGGNMNTGSGRKVWDNGGSIAGDMNAKANDKNRGNILAETYKLC